ncbi:DinB family protein [Calidifontibacillus oryziterrae]|uniref:DinB family protein n=1 Tax=Calidifontibacillus oryziterrae TaxID=1191699 RepID=UPI00030AFA56|nr:DinB family protein [Calidifontibacillus oryziterrae]
MIHDIGEYISFLDGVRKRTMDFAKAVPNSMLEWRPAENKFSTGDLLRHLGSSQLMYLHAFETQEWVYGGHDRTKGETIEEIINYLNECHEKLIDGLSTLGNDLLIKKIPTLHGHEVSSWRIMMACVEHEIHHRGQLSTYLQLNNIQPPKIFGLKIEDVKLL